MGPTPTRRQSKPEKPDALYAMKFQEILGG